MPSPRHPCIAVIVAASVKTIAAVSVIYIPRYMPANATWKRRLRLETPDALRC